MKNIEVANLWGEGFIPTTKDDVDKIISKSRTKKVVESLTLEKLLKSKRVSVEDKISAIRDEVHRILGKYDTNTVTIRDYDTYMNYIDKSIENGIIAIDTETNNTIDTIDCKLMGPCLYTPGMKSAYIPVNHIDRVTEKLLDNQLTEEQLAAGFKKLVDNNVKIIYHNASFDIEVIYSTCGVMLPLYWDTLSGAKLLDENEQAGLKYQYKIHIDPEDDKYSIEHLFGGLSYGLFEPELFALYAATDAYKTYRLYEYQLSEFEKDSNRDVYELFKTIEIPIIPVIVKMELRGIEVDVEYAKKMSVVYHKKLDEVQGRIDEEVQRLKPVIDDWRLSPEANRKPESKSKTGVGKSKNEQLTDPIEFGSPTQMAILLYDILKVPVVDNKYPRGTGAEILKELAETYKIPICTLLLEKRGVDILIDSFIDKIPNFAKKDNSLHANFNPCGTVTGRFSSTDPNLQQIPSHDKFIRMIFKGRCVENTIEINSDNCYKISKLDDVELSDGSWVRVKDLKIGDLIKTSCGEDKVKDIQIDFNYYFVYV